MKGLIKHVSQSLSSQVASGCIHASRAELLWLGLLAILCLLLSLVLPAEATAQGTPWAWGDNFVGQLGDGTTIQRTTPVQVSTLSSVTAVVAGTIGIHSLALKSDGTVWAWGHNGGQLGDGTTTTRLTPVRVSVLIGVTAIAAGGVHSLALSNGRVWVWGINWAGQLGDGTTTTRVTPVQVSGLTNVTAIAGGGIHSLALKSDGTVWAWGANGIGELGDGTTTNRTTPVQVGSLTGVTAIAGGVFHSLALSNGTVWAWGANGFGELGDGTTTNRVAPVQVSGLTNVTAIAGDNGYSLALKSDGTVWAWGIGGGGQLGDGTLTNRNTPVQVSGLTNVTAIAGGNGHSLALKSDGTVWAWGWNLSGKLGDGTTTDRYIPVQVKDPGGIGFLTGVTAVSAGYYHSLALKCDGIGAPTISPITPGQIEEGAFRPVLITGSGFIPGKTSVTTSEPGRISVGKVFVSPDGKQLGTTFTVGPFRDLPKGSTRNVTVFVSNGGCAVTTTTLTVVGLDEIDIPSGSSQTVSSSDRVSIITVNPGAVLNVAWQNPPITIESNFDVNVAGTIQVVAGNGGDGASGHAGCCGGEGGQPGGGGAGGAGGAGSAVAGSTGSSGTNNGGGPGGTGGVGGDGGGGFIFGPSGDNGSSGVPPSTGTRNAELLPLLPGSGGGGGGGGGGYGYIARDAGGSGGGAGGGGGAFRIITSRWMYVTASGIIRANGGNGGRGGDGVGGFFGSGGGGGGGGGAGGAIHLQGFYENQGVVEARTGGWGGGGGPTPSPTPPVLPPSGRVRVDGLSFGRPTDPVAFRGPDLWTLLSGVYTSQTVLIDGTAPMGTPVTLSVIDDATGATTPFSVSTPPNSTNFSIPVTLFPGFNTVRVSMVSPDGLTLVNPSLRDLKILFMPNAQ